VPRLKGKPTGGPEPAESLAAAKKRIAKATSSHDCEEIYKLNPVSRPDYNVSSKCTQLETLAGLKASGAAEYPGGAVIDYRSNGRTLRAVLIVDSDGYYSVAFVDQTHTDPSVGTEFAPQFDGVATRVVEAFRDKDCDAFQQLSLRRFGVGSTGSCAYVERPSPLSILAESYPEAKAKNLGGNRDYAFYGVASPRSFVTMVLARESDSGAAAGTSPLPEDAPTYGFVNAFLTTPGSGPSG
jgi:hypothetical protein